MARRQAISLPKEANSTLRSSRRQTEKERAGGPTAVPAFCHHAAHSAASHLDVWRTLSTTGMEKKRMAWGPGVGWGGGGGGWTTTGPDATHPPAICQNLGGYWQFGRGGGGGFPRWGGLRATHYYHMHTSRGDVCLGVWGFGGMYVKALGLHLSRGRAPNARSSLRNRRHLYRAPSR